MFHISTVGRCLAQEEGLAWCYISALASQNCLSVEPGVTLLNSNLNLPLSFVYIIVLMIPIGGGPQQVRNRSFDACYTPLPGDGPCQANWTGKDVFVEVLDKFPTPIHEAIISTILLLLLLQNPLYNLLFVTWWCGFLLSGAGSDFTLQVKS